MPRYNDPPTASEQEMWAGPSDDEPQDITWTVGTKLREAVEYGDLGVRVKLHHSNNTSSVFWVNGNSYVVAGHDKGCFLTPSGERCHLLSIHGNGEIRWRVNRRADKSELLAVYYFGLKPKA